jgi:hypothetical protein
MSDENEAEMNPNEVVEAFAVLCPECLKMGRRSEYNTSAVLYVHYTEEWIHSLVIDCDDTSDHVVKIEGAWTNPIVKDVLARFGLTKRKIMAEHAKRMAKKEVPHLQAVH